MTFSILTDSTADLQEDWAAAHQIDLIGLTINLDGKTYETVGPDRLDSESLLEKMKQGAKPTTSQINVGEFEAYFRQQVQSNQPVLYIAFSSVLSGTYQSAMIARELVLEDFPEARIDIVDTLAAAGGEGFLVIKAAEAREAGKSLEETKQMILDLLPRLRTYFLVDDLNHLMRGGRLSKTSAIVGNIVNIKPLLWIDASGKLVPLAKVRGRKKGIKEMLKQATSDIQDPTAVVAYSNDEQSAQSLKEELLSNGEIQEVIILPLGPVISAHVGPDTLAVFVIGKDGRQ
ncbi:DegV family protein [Streptococcus ferus]|uniref:Putative fatty acid-binding protein, DegV family n=1 Tax=Streptococcus ferus TaxID=1345 RepID=A0A2X3VHY5_9STRE|nr:DegV family protein [Streptococcus ferus]SQF39158.1 putative fatty acid-binding protein, DegV family [Streptococcus ferus]